MIRKVIRTIGIIFSFIYPQRLEEFFHKIYLEFYSGYMSTRFKKFCGRLDGELNLIGGKYIEVGEKSFLGKDVRLWAWDKFLEKRYTPQIKIGDNTAINSGCMISCINKIEIGNNVGISSNCVIIDNVHGDFRDHKLTFNNDPNIPDVFLQAVLERDLCSKGPVIIEDGVHLGEGVVIMPGVTIGHHSVISSHAIITRKVPPYSIVANEPSKIVTSFGK